MEGRTLLSISTSAAFESSLFEHIAVNSCSESSIRFVRGSSSRYCVAFARRRNGYSDDQARRGSRLTAANVAVRVGAGGRAQQAGADVEDFQNARRTTGKLRGVGWEVPRGETREARRQRPGWRETGRARARMPTGGTRRGGRGTHTWSKALIGARKMMAVAGIGNEVRASAPESASAHNPTPGHRTRAGERIDTRARNLP